eukprot:scaffold22492_cov84-Isochrysis_galbana.AAC.1
MTPPHRPARKASKAEAGAAAQAAAGAEAGVVRENLGSGSSSEALSPFSQDGRGCQWYDASGLCRE